MFNFLFRAWQKLFERISRIVVLIFLILVSSTKESRVIQIWKTWSIENLASSLIINKWYLWFCFLKGWRASFILRCLFLKRHIRRRKYEGLIWLAWRMPRKRSFIQCIFIFFVNYIWNRRFIEWIGISKTSCQHLSSLLNFFLLNLNICSLF